VQIIRLHYNFEDDRVRGSDGCDDCNACCHAGFWLQHCSVSEKKIHDCPRTHCCERNLTFDATYLRCSDRHLKMWMQEKEAFATDWKSSRQLLVVCLAKDSGPMLICLFLLGGKTRTKNEYRESSTSNCAFLHWSAVSNPDPSVPCCCSCWQQIHLLGSLPWPKLLSRLVALFFFCSKERKFLELWDTENAERSKSKQINERTQRHGGYNFSLTFHFATSQKGTADACDLIRLRHKCRNCRCFGRF